MRFVRREEVSVRRVDSMLTGHCLKNVESPSESTVRKRLLSCAGTFPGWFGISKEWKRKSVRSVPGE